MQGACTIYILYTRTFLNAQEVELLFATYSLEEVYIILQQDSLLVSRLLSLLREGLSQEARSTLMQDLRVLMYFESFSISDRKRLLEVLSAAEITQLFGSKLSVGTLLGKKILSILDTFGAQWIKMYINQPQAIKNMGAYLVECAVPLETKLRTLELQHARTLILSDTELSEWIGDMNTLFSGLQQVEHALRHISSSLPIDTRDYTLLKPYIIA